MQQSAEVTRAILTIDFAGESLIGTSSLPFPRSDEELAVMHGKCSGIPFGGNKPAWFRIGTGIIKNRDCIGARICCKKPVAVRSYCQGNREVASIALLRKLCAEIKDISTRAFDDSNFICIG